MAKGVLHRINLAAGKRLKHLQAVAGKTAEELLERRYAETAEQTLRGAEAVSTILKEKNEVARASGKKRASTKKKSKVSKRINRKSVKRKKK